MIHRGDAEVAEKMELTQLPQFAPEINFHGRRICAGIESGRMTLAKVDVVKTNLCGEPW
jgi:hypothetical protein